MVAQFIAKATNSERPIYVLSLMSCSIKKLKSHMLFSCKNFRFSDLKWEKNFCSRKWWEGGLVAPQSPLSLYRHTTKDKILISLIWNKILNIWTTLFEFIQTFGNGIEREPQKPSPKLKKICILYTYKKYSILTESNESGNLLARMC